MKRLFLSTALLALTSTNSYALTLDQALTSGYANNEQLQVIRTDFLTEIESFPQALAGFMPRISAELNSSDSKTTTRSKLLPPSNNTSTNAGSYTKSISMEQSIFSGGSSMAALKAAQSGFRAARGKYYANEQEIFLDSITNYVNCVEAKEKYNISKMSVTSNQTQLEAIKEKFKLGESTETEIASAESALAAAEANQAVAYANFEAAKANFTRIFGVEPTDVSMPSLPDNLPKTLDELLAKATISNPSIHSAHHSTKASKSNEYIRKGALLPQVGFSVSYGKTDYLPENLGSRVNNDSTTATLSVKIPIFARGGAEYSEIRQAKYQTRRLASQLDNQIKIIKTNGKSNWEALNAAQVRIQASSTAVKAAEIAYEGVKQEEMLGSKTIIDVLNIEERLNKARESNIEAQKEYVLAAFRIKSLLGELTAKSMKLPVNYFEPEQEFKKAKLKIVGF